MAPPTAASRTSVLVRNGWAGATSLRLVPGIELPDDTTAVIGLLSGVRPEVSQYSVKGFDWPGSNVSVCSATVKSPHRIRSVKLCVVVPLFKTVAVTVTVCPIVAELAGEIAMLVTTMLVFTVTETVAKWDSAPLAPVTVTVNVAALTQLMVSVE